VRDYDIVTPEAIYAWSGTKPYRITSFKSSFPKKYSAIAELCFWLSHEKHSDEEPTGVATSKRSVNTSL
jgi:hypothetical protein